MDDTILVDSDVLIDAGRGLAEALDCLQRHEAANTLTISVITQLELLVGCQNKAEQRKLVKSLRRFDVLKLSEDISDSATLLITRYRLSHGLMMPDALIAATALVHDIPLLSKNQRDYRFITGLNLLPYP